MPADDPVAAGSPSAASSDLAIIVALGVERATLQPHLARRSARISLHQSGPGEERAATAARAALARGATALISWGLAGALEPGLAPGTVLLPKEVLAQKGTVFRSDALWHANLHAALHAEFVLEERTLLGVSDVLSGRQSKTHAAGTTGAVGVDMESAAIAEAAQLAGARFVALRVIFDSHADLLPPRADRWIDERGNRRIAAAIDAALTPADWPALWILGQRYRTARRVLDRLARRLLPSDLFLPASADSG